MRYLFKTFYKSVAQSGRFLGVGIDIGVRLFESRDHADDTGDILGACTLAALLRAAFDDIRQSDTLAGIEKSDTLGAVELMSREGEHIDILFLDVYMDMTDSLNGIGMEDNALFFTYSPYLGDGLDAADLVVCVHNGHKASVLADSVGDLLSRDHTVFVHIEERHFKALFFELLERMQNRMMLERGGDYMLLTLSCADCRRGDERLVISLAAAGGECYFIGLATENLGRLFACLSQRVRRSLSDGMEARRVAVDLVHIRQHRFYCCAARLCRGRVINIDSGHLYQNSSQ